MNDRPNYYQIVYSSAFFIPNTKVPEVLYIFFVNMKSFASNEVTKLCRSLHKKQIEVMLDKKVKELQNIDNFYFKICAVVLEKQ